MDKSLNVRVGLDMQSFMIIQELVNYAESRFKKILLAMGNVSKIPELDHNWMQSGLRKELVCIFY
jgi:hypothetical protein